MGQESSNYSPTNYFWGKEAEEVQQSSSCFQRTTSGFGPDKYCREDEQSEQQTRRPVKVHLQGLSGVPSEVSLHCKESEVILKASQ